MVFVRVVLFFGNKFVVELSNPITITLDGYETQAHGKLTMLFTICIRLKV